MHQLAVQRMDSAGVSHCEHMLEYKQNDENQSPPTKKIEFSSA